MAFVSAIAVVVLALTAGVIAATLRLRGIGFVLGAYVVAAAEVVALLIALSPFRLVGPGAIVAGEVLLLGAAAFGWTRSGRPRPALPRLDVRTAARRNPLVAGLAAVVGGGLAQALVLAPALRETERLGIDAVVFSSAWRPAARGWRLRRFDEAGTLAIRD